MREIYIQSGMRREIAVVEDGKLVEYLIEDENDSAEAIYVGRVERVVPGMKAAFVDIGQEKNGFLPLEEKNQLNAPKLQSGMSVLVQIRKEAQGTKGAFLSRDISLCGETVLLMPLNDKIGVSSRITDATLRRALQELGREITGGQFGLVMRSAAADAGEDMIRQETESLLARWDEISREAPTAHVPSIISGARSQLDMLLTDYRLRGIDCIHTDDESLAEQLKDVCDIRLSKPGLMTLMGLTRQRDKALERRVWLDSGGNLVIDPCEALTVIDVNTAKFTGKRQLEETILKLNLEACREVARQVRLRNLSGIILIDMIDMDAQENREKVLDALRGAFAADRIKTVIHGFTSLGLVEMTRKKSRRPLRDDFTKECRHCRGRGRTIIEEENHG